MCECTFREKWDGEECRNHLWRHNDFQLGMILLFAMIVGTIVFTPLIIWSNEIGAAERERIQNFDCLQMREYLAFERSTSSYYDDVEQQFKWLCVDDKSLEMTP
jgi:hypothetical protein